MSPSVLVGQQRWILDANGFHEFVDQVLADRARHLPVVYAELFPRNKRLHHLADRLVCLFNWFARFLFLCHVPIPFTPPYEAVG
jgi:hypothetical protein